MLNHQLYNDHQGQLGMVWKFLYLDIQEISSKYVLTIFKFYVSMVKSLREQT